MSTERGFEIHDVAGTGVDDLLQVLSHGYGRPFRRDWFAWKHDGAPWGPSRRLVASDEGGLLGICFAMPWRLRVGDTVVECDRLVDGATTPRATRRGVFRAVVAELVDAWDATRRPGIVLATATPEARDAHVKNGAVALEPIEFFYRPVRWSVAGVESGPGVLDTYQGDLHPDRLATAWDVDSLRWRIDPRSDVDYRVSRLAASNSPHGLVHHTVTTHGVRVLVVSTEWGPKRDRDQLVRALALRSRAVAVLAPMGPGTPTPRRRAALPRGRSQLCVWGRSDSDSVRPADPEDRACWSLDGLDLEGVI